MIRLSLTSMEECIMAAYQKYLTTTPGDFRFRTSAGNDVLITCMVVGTQFNCGVPGFNMAAAETNNLRQWCITHPGDGWSFGFRDVDPLHPNTVNIILRDRTHLLFNFHVNLDRG